MLKDNNHQAPEHTRSPEANSQPTSALCWATMTYMYEYVSVIVTIHTAYFWNLIIDQLELTIREFVDS